MDDALNERPAQTQEAEIVTLPSKKARSNRTDAVRSTGPRSIEGKARSRWNAVRHGILARATPIAEGGARENVLEFQYLLAQLRRDLQPGTALEEMLIERIASCYWRLGRVVRAETAAIQARVEDLLVDDEVDTRRRVFELDDEGTEPADRVQDLPGVDSILAMIRFARDQIEGVGYLIDEELERFSHIVGYVIPGMEKPQPRLSNVAEQERKAAALQALGDLEEDLIESCIKNATLRAKKEASPTG
ncbi:MAG: hypothetical protein HY271_09780 [Deltaproteobacteria bacterium]|nr:hypothetical protein [Deltaproteobacteria bacterium]